MASSSEIRDDNPSTADLIRERYNLHFCSSGVETDTFGNVKVFLIGYQSSPVSSRVNAEFINLCGKKGDTVFVQSDDFDAKLRERDFYKMLKTKAKKRGYAVRSKDMRYYTRLQRLFYEIRHLINAYYEETSEPKKYRIAVKIFAANLHLSVRNDQVVEMNFAIDETLSTHQKAIKRKIIREIRGEEFSHLFFHIPSEILFKPAKDSLPTIPGGDLSSFLREQEDNYETSEWEKIFPIERYNRFYSRFKQYPVVVMSPKPEYLNSLEAPLRSALDTQLRTMNEIFCSEDKKNPFFTLLYQEEHYQDYIYIRSLQTMYRSTQTRAVGLEFLNQIHTRREMGFPF